MQKLRKTGITGKRMYEEELEEVKPFKHLGSTICVSGEIGKQLSYIISKEARMNSSLGCQNIEGVGGYRSLRGVIKFSAAVVKCKKR